MEPLVIDKVTKHYLREGQPAVEAVKGVSFSVRPGEIFGLLGPNGAGKTTLISVITTLEKPTSGDVTIFGHSVLTEPLKTKMSIGVVPQEIVSSGFFNLEELLQYHSGYYGLRHNLPRIRQLLDRMSLTEHKSKIMRQLSGGMRRRMMIAKALVHSPKVLLLDEPTAGVDVALRNQLWDFVRELRAEGVSIVLTTHYLQEAEELCDRVGIINKGELKYVGPTKEIIKDLTQRKVEVQLRSGQVIPLIMSKGDDLGVILKLQNLKLEDIHDLNIEEGTLEDAFVKVLSL
ncbi:MAG: ABC transporter ATP-binding protein [Bdellovibrio sp. CG10_big_fil_rev_8_21_14_0_10_47_8]|nr:MAG: ABC transporter ATP-binding protein [Bdellovibrio sp. CG10_big_fil_rev_8_21_14_0_10_47_8]